MNEEIKKAVVNVDGTDYDLTMTPCKEQEDIEEFDAKPFEYVEAE